MKNRTFPMPAKPIFDQIQIYSIHEIPMITVNTHTSATSSFWGTLVIGSILKFVFSIKVFSRAQNLHPSLVLIFFLYLGIVQECSLLYVRLVQVILSTVLGSYPNTHPLVFLIPLKKQKQGVQIKGFCLKIDTCTYSSCQKIPFTTLAFYNKIL